MDGRTWVEVRWGVRYDDDMRYSKGHIEWFGVRPGGDIGVFDEAMARYIASNSPKRAVVRKSVVHTETHFDWEEV